VVAAKSQVEAVCAELISEREGDGLLLKACESSCSRVPSPSRRVRQKRQTARRSQLGLETRATEKEGAGGSQSGAATRLPSVAQYKVPPVQIGVNDPYLDCHPPYALLQPFNHPTAHRRADAEPATSRAATLQSSAASQTVPTLSSVELATLTQLSTTFSSFTSRSHFSESRPGPPARFSPSCHHLVSSSSLASSPTQLRNKCTTARPT
jgi:hypothetical protein